MEISELFSAIVDWARSTGAERLNELPGVWHRRTEKVGVLGPLDVRINAHKDEREGIPPFSASISMDEYFPGLIALVGPTGGILLWSPKECENEAGLIRHFREQPSRA